MSQSFTSILSSLDKMEAVHQILEVICRTTGLGFSAVAHVTRTQWIACAVRDEIEFGLKAGGELEIETTICDEICQSGSSVVIDHVAQDPRFCHHPTPAQYGFQSYISVPIKMPDGRFFGTLCAIDPKPTRVDTPETIGMFTLFADLIGQYLATQERVLANDAALLSERELAKLREQFIAVLGHDLRNPLAAIEAGISVLRMLPGEQDTLRLLDILQNSTNRINEMISNILDFARGRLGDGLSLNRVHEPNLERVLEQVVTELQVTAPTRTVQSDFSIHHSVYCESARIAQMLSNLLANALTHSTPNTTIKVRARSSEDEFMLSVTNDTENLAPIIKENLFEPFARGAAKSGEAGLGLGLYIAAEIARAHDGKLEVATTEDKICFTFTMPNQATSTAHS